MISKIHVHTKIMLTLSLFPFFVRALLRYLEPKFYQNVIKSKISVDGSFCIAQGQYVWVFCDNLRRVSTILISANTTHGALMI